MVCVREAESVFLVVLSLGLYPLLSHLSITSPTVLVFFCFFFKPPSSFCVNGEGKQGMYPSDVETAFVCAP
jgi:hypothetical protein